MYNIPRGLTVPTYDLEEKYALLRGLSYLRSRCSRAKIQPCQVTFNGTVRTVLERARLDQPGVIPHMLLRSCINRIDTHVHIL